MKPLNTLIFALLLSFSSFWLIQAGPLVTRATAPSPTRPFIVSAFQTPYPLGQQLTGFNLTARNGNLFLSNRTNVQKAVFFTDSQTNGWLDSKNPQKLYIDTSSGLLAYATPAPPGAVYPGFAHFGHGTQIYINADGGTEIGPSAFEWTGTTYANNWWACSAGGGEYHVYKLVSVIGGTPDLSKCIVLDSLAALDYSGASPAVDSYS